jgi:hypothetical protein
MNQEYLENSIDDRDGGIIVLTEPLSQKVSTRSPVVVTLLVLLVASAVGLGWYFLQRREVTGFPRLKEALYVGSAHIKGSGESIHADFLLMNGADVSTLTIVPFIAGGIATQAALPQSESDPLQTRLTTRDGRVTALLSFYGKETEGFPGDYQGTLRGDLGEGGGWTFHPLQALPFPADVRPLQEVAQLRAQIKELEDEVIALHSDKQQLEEQRSAVQIRQQTLQAEAKQAAVQDASPEAIQDSIDTLRAEETMLIEMRSRTIRFSDRGRAIALGQDSLDRELRWIEAQLTKLDQPVFIDPNEQQRYNHAQRVKELELLIAQEERLIAKLLDAP